MINENNLSKQTKATLMPSPKTAGEILLETSINAIDWGSVRANKTVPKICRQVLGTSDCTLGDFVRIQSWPKIANAGTTSLAEITDVLAEKGLHKGMSELELRLFRVTHGAPELLRIMTMENDGVQVMINCHGGPLPDNHGGKGDWYDLFVAEDVDMKAGDFRLISMGISIMVPPGYTAYMLPRSSTFKKFGLLQTNSMGVIDSSYCGDNDIIKFPALATRDVHISKGDRIAQITIMPTTAIRWISTPCLGNGDRGGFGSTGR